MFVFQEKKLVQIYIFVSSFPLMIFIFFWNLLDLYQKKQKKTILLHVIFCWNTLHCRLAVRIDEILIFVIWGTFFWLLL